MEAEINCEFQSQLLGEVVAVVDDAGNIFDYGGGSRGNIAVRHSRSGKLNKQ
jgi:hypothetical protein